MCNFMGNFQISFVHDRIKIWKEEWYYLFLVSIVASFSFLLGLFFWGGVGEGAVSIYTQNPDKNQIDFLKENTISLKSYV